MNSPVQKTMMILLLLLSQQANAADSEMWDICGSSWKDQWKLIADTNQRDDNAIEMNANSSKVVVKDGKEVVDLEGNIFLQQRDMMLTSDRAHYDRQTNLFEADGNVKLQDASFAIEGDKAKIELKNSEGDVKNAEYRLINEHFRGSAEKLKLEGKGKINLQGAEFTSCNPGNRDWLLKAYEVELDNPDNSGTAKHVRIEFMGVPFFYTPYMTFPLGRRKSGLLLPTTGSSDNTGSDISIPLYLNLAPNYDLTLTPRSMETRGTQINSELRYMTEKSRGTLNHEQLDYDMQLGEKRYAYFYKHQSTLGDNWRLNLNMDYVSDEEYINELKDGIGNVSLTHLESKGDFSYQGESWNAGIKYQSFQPLVGSKQQYQRQPQLNLAGNWPLIGGLSFGLNSEYVRLDRETGVIAERKNYEPTLSWELRGMAGYFETKVKYGATHYLLTDQESTIPEEKFTEQQIERGSLSVKTGIYLDRYFEAFDQAYIHSLEPEIYYLYIPYIDQTAIPVFDTSLPEFNYSALFRDDRFTGVDRWGDTRQLTTALTTRLIEESSGREIISASIGQIHYLQDRLVTLGGTEVLDQTLKTDLAGQIKAEPNDYTRLKADLVWNVEEDRLELGNGQLDLRADNRRVLRINYRYRHLTQRQIDAAIYWPITTRWRILARGFHDIEEDQTMEKMAGLEYESCCWAVRFVQKRNYMNSGVAATASPADELPLEENVSFWFQFELKGLGNFGNKADNFIEKDVLGDRLNQ